MSGRLSNFVAVLLLALAVRAMADPSGYLVLSTGSVGNVCRGDVVTAVAGVETSATLAGAGYRLTFDETVLSLRDAYDPSVKTGNERRVDLTDPGEVEFAVSREEPFLRDLPNEALGLFVFDVIGNVNDHTSVTLDVEQVVFSPLSWGALDATSAEVTMTVGQAPDPSTATSSLTFSGIADRGLTPGDVFSLVADVQSDEALTGVDCRLTFDPSVVALRSARDPSAIEDGWVVFGLGAADSGVVEFSVSRQAAILRALPHEPVGAFTFEAIGNPSDQTTFTLEVMPAVAGPLVWGTVAVSSSEASVAIGGDPPPPTASSRLTLSGAPTSGLAPGDVFSLVADVMSEEALTGVDCRLTFDPSVVAVRSTSELSSDRDGMTVFGLGAAGSGIVEFSVSREAAILHALSHEPVGAFTFEVVGAPTDQTTFTLEITQAVAGPWLWKVIDTSPSFAAIEVAGTTPGPTGSVGIVSAASVVGGKAHGDLLSVIATLDASTAIADANCRLEFDPDVLSLHSWRDPSLHNTSLSVAGLGEEETGAINFAVSRTHEFANALPYGPIGHFLFEVVGEDASQTSISLKVDGATAGPLNWAEIDVAPASTALVVEEEPERLFDFGFGASTPSLVLPGEPFVVPIEVNWPLNLPPYSMDFTLEFDPGSLVVEDVRLADDPKPVIYLAATTESSRLPGVIRFTALCDPNAFDRGTTAATLFEVTAMFLAPPPTTSTLRLSCDEAWLGNGAPGPFAASTAAATDTIVEMNMRSLTVSSLFGTPRPAGTTYYETGTTVAAQVEHMVYETSLTRQVCDGWLGSGSIPALGAGTSASALLDVDSTLEWQWRRQHYLTVVSALGSPVGEGWYDEGDTAFWSVDSPIVVTAAERWLAATTSSAVLMDEPSTVTIGWRQQFYLDTVSSPTHGGSIIPGDSWQDAFTTTGLEARPTSGSNYLFLSWDNDTASTGALALVYIDSATTATAFFGQRGDLSGDDQLTPYDVRLLLDYMQGADAPVDELRLTILGDVNSDGVIGVADLLALLNTLNADARPPDD